MVRKYVPPHARKGTTKETHSRPSSNARGYTHTWRDYSKVYRELHPMCATCGVRYSEHVDHIVPVKKGGSFWDEENHAAICGECHNAKTARERVSK